ncbi:MAG: bacillithiol biosynthesis cysteine-adding enzyme BshC [Moheibacter sp.]
METIQSTRWNAEEYGKFSTLVRDYMNKQQTTSDLYNRFPSEDSLVEQTKDRLKSFKNREILCDSLENQLSFLDLSELQIENLEKLRRDNTVTISTGHQLNLFTGPVYIFYKILQVVKCCNHMNVRHPEFNFVPIFWMATEDHDFEEINHFCFNRKRYSWERDFGGATGRMNLDGIDKVFEEFFQDLPDSKHADELKQLANDSYLNSKTLTEATQRLIQELFGKYGVLMVDGDDRELKKLMISAFEEDLIHNTAFKKVSETNHKLAENHYNIQVNPREINLFYLEGDSVRERIVFENGKFKVLNTQLKFSEQEIKEELKNYPEKFSPNVILRPLYQETILPNVAYIGGFGELSYWLQLKSFFEAMSTDYPLVIGRNSMLVVSSKQRESLEKLSVDFSDLMLPVQEIINRNVIQNSETGIDFSKYEEMLTVMFDELNQKAVRTDVTFSKMVAAQRAKQLKGLGKMLKRLERAERKKQAERTERIEAIYKKLFPNNKLQERVDNFSEFHLEYGFNFIDEIYDEIKPIDFCFTIKTFDN